MIMLEPSYIFQLKSILKANNSYSSPDLALSEFWLFGYIREQLTSHPDAKNLIKQIAGIVNSISKEGYEKEFQKWI
jgi:hypothetical protein